MIMKNIIILCGAFLFLITNNEVKSQSKKQKDVTIVYPKNNQKVRGAHIIERLTQHSGKIIRQSPSLQKTFQEQ
ncbi:hypothetical protein IO90_14245 [Chryseobacterium sp. FH1]|nr:hypothetical protein IO90_14245 [Chryseobacterium sp. FH1]